MPGVGDLGSFIHPTFPVGTASAGASDDSSSPTIERDGSVDSIVKQALQQVMAQSNPSMSGMIQNRPQVMFPGAIHPKQLPMSEPVGNVQATTRAGQKRNDMNQLVASTGNLVKQFVNNKREKEDRDLTADLALITAATSNPEDPHNKAIIEAIASDPKRVKRLQKAIGYNPFSGEAPPPETKTMMKFSQDQQQKQAIAKMVQDKIAAQMGPQAAQQNVQTQGSQGQSQGGQPGQQPRSAMDNLMSRMPNTHQLSPMVELQASLIKSGILPKADTSLTSMTTLLKEVMTSDAKYAEIQGKLMVVDRNAANKLAEVRERGKALMDLQRMKEQGAGKRAEIRAGATTESARIRANATVEAAKLHEKTVSDRADVTHKHNLLIKETDQIDKDIKNLDVQIAAEKDPKRKQSLIREQEMNKELKKAKENLMDAYDKQGAQLDEQLKRSPTSLLNEPDDKNEDDIDKQMDDEDKIF